METFSKNRFLLFLFLGIFSVQANADFSYESKYDFSKMKFRYETKKCYIKRWKLKTTYPEVEEMFSSKGELYRPKRIKGQSPVVVLFPPVGGKNFLDEDTAEELCEKGITVFIPTTDFTGIEDDVPPPVEDHDHALFRVVAVTKAIIAYSHGRKDLNGNKIGILGASLGGIVSSYAMGALPEIQAGYFIAAGGDVPNILAYSWQKRVVKLKKFRQEEISFTSDDEYEEWLRGYLTQDPLEMASHVPSELVNMVVSDNDTSVPTKNQYLLYKAFGEPKVRISSKSHVWTILNAMSGRGRDRIKKFFLKQFKKENVRLTSVKPS